MNVKEILTKNNINIPPEAKYVSVCQTDYEVRFWANKPKPDEAGDYLLVNEDDDFSNGDYFIDTKESFYLNDESSPLAPGVYELSTPKYVITGSKLYDSLDEAKKAAKVRADTKVYVVEVIGHYAFSWHND